MVGLKKHPPITWDASPALLRAALMAAAAFTALGCAGKTKETPPPPKDDVIGMARAVDDVRGTVNAAKVSVGRAIEDLNR